MTLAVSDHDLALIRGILSRVVPDAEYLAFGSRLGDRPHRYSDLDIAIRSNRPIPLAQLSALEEAFAESDLPYWIDIVDLHRVSPEFQRIVESHHIRL